MALILAECRARGIILAARDGQLLFDAPAGALTPALRAALAAQREEIGRELIAQEIDRQLDQLVPYRGDNGRPCWIHRDLLNPERREDLEMLELVCWALNRKPALPCEPPPPPTAPRAECRAAAEAAGWPVMEIRPGERLIGGDAAWRLFAARSFAPDIFVALDKLRSAPPGTRRYGQK